MFTGIVQGNQPIVSLEKKIGLYTLSIEMTEELVEGLQIGGSVAVDGVCLTVVTIDGLIVTFHAMMETLRLTTLQFLEVGKKVNIERSSRVGDEVGGHRLSGHVHGMAEIIRMDEPENNKSMTFQVPRDWMKYIVQKGFIALDGCSLTVVNPDRHEGTFDVWFIPETLSRTGFGTKAIGDCVNLEFDPNTQIIVETIERIMRE